MNRAALVDEVKSLQRSQQNFCYQWNRYCEDHSPDSTKDPNRLDAQFLSRALRDLGYRSQKGGASSQGAPSSSYPPAQKGATAASPTPGYRNTSTIPQQWAQAPPMHAAPPPPPPPTHEGYPQYAGPEPAYHRTQGVPSFALPQPPAPSPATANPAYAYPASGKGGLGLVHSINGKLRDPGWERLWRGYCDTYGYEEYQPEGHTAEFLEAALKAVNYQWESYSAPQPSPQPQPQPPSRGDQRHAGLVQEVKHRQRENGWHTRWADYCHVHGDGTRDPSRHTAEFLQGALHTLRKRPDSVAMQLHTGLVEEIKVKQKADAMWNNHWQRYCERFSDGTRDPNIHEAFFLQKAMEEVEKYVSTEKEKHELVDKVKQKQRDKPLWSTRWTDYCTINGDGTRDPAHHDNHFLKRALRDLPDDRKCDHHDNHVKQVKEQQRNTAWQALWIEYCELHSDGTRDPALHDTGFLRKALREISRSSRQIDTLTERRASEIQKLCEARRTAQRSQGFSRADELRDMLRSLGVEVDDKKKSWRSDDGLNGTFTNEQNMP